MGFTRMLHGTIILFVVYGLWFMVAAAHCAVAKFAKP